MKLSHTLFSFWRNLYFVLRIPYTSFLLLCLSRVESLDVVIVVDNYMYFLVVWLLRLLLFYGRCRHCFTCVMHNVTVWVFCSFFAFGLCRGYMWNKVISQLLFQALSTSDWNYFISARGNLAEIIAGANCSWWIFSSVFSVTEIILAAEIILFQFQTWLHMKYKHRNYFKVILFHM